MSAPLTSYEELQVQDLVAYVKSRGGTGRVLRFNRFVVPMPPRERWKALAILLMRSAAWGEVTLTLPEREVPS